MDLGRSLADQFPSGFLVFPRVRLPAVVTEQTYALPVTTKTRRLIVLTGLTDTQIHHIANALAEPPRAGRPWALPLASRVVLTTAALRTNLTVRHQPAAVFDISKSQAHRIIDDLTPHCPTCSTPPSMETGAAHGPWTAS